MGMFDTIRTEQVKCFPVPMIDIKEDLGRMYFYKSGGSLKFYDVGDEVPWQTPCYNYGQNFAIFDYANIESTPKFVMVLGGKISKIYDYTKIPRGTVMNTVIDNYGRLLKVHNVRDCKDIVEEYKISYNTFITLKKNYANSTKFLADGHTQNIQEFARIRRIAFQEFEQNWCCENTDERCIAIYDTTNVGAVVDHIIRFPEETEKAIKTFRKEFYGKKVETIKQYKKWLKKNNITKYNEIVNKL